MLVNVKSKRPYTMGARAEAVTGTRQRITGAVRELAFQDYELDPTLEAVAGRAGVSVQTVLRHFGDRERLFDAALDEAIADITAEREAPAGDVGAAVRVIVTHYEARGDFVVHLLGHERDNPRVARITGPGRRLHREWVAVVFAPQLAGRADRDQLIDLLVVATDVFTWKLLRRDRGLTRPETESRIRRLVDAIAASPATSTRGSS
jgi:AcrR family transcriptional regulator